MPALAQTKPWWVSQITVPPRRRTIRRLSARISSQSAGSFPVSLGEGAGGRAGATSAARPAAPRPCSPTFWATISTSPGADPLGRRPRGEHPGQVVAGAHLGQGRQRPEPQRALPASSSPASRAGRRPRASPPAAARHQRGQVARGVDVEREAGAADSSATATPRAARPGRGGAPASRGRAGAAGPRAGAAASRWCRSRRRRARAPPRARRGGGDDPRRGPRAGRAAGRRSAPGPPRRPAAATAARPRTTAAFMPRGGSWSGTTRAPAMRSPSAARLGVGGHHHHPGQAGRRRRRRRARRSASPPAARAAPAPRAPGPGAAARRAGA